MNDGERREVAVELSLPHAEEEEGVNKQSTTILEQVRHITQDKKFKILYVFNLCLFSN